MADINKLIEIAKKIDPNIGPTFDMAVKSMSEEQVLAKLENFFSSYEKALKIVEQHPGKSYGEIKEIFDSNARAHAINSLIISAFVNDVLEKKGDLGSLAISASRRIILADERLNKFYAENKQVNPAETSKKIDEKIKAMFVGYFSSLKGKDINREKIVNDLTISATKEIAEEIRELNQGGK